MAPGPQGDDAETSDPPSLEDLSRRIDAARGERQTPERQARSEGADMGRGMRVASELLAALLVGAGLGWGFDAMFATKPWALLAGTGLGFAAGMLNTMRALEEIDRDASHADAETIDEGRDDA